MTEEEDKKEESAAEQSKPEETSQAETKKTQHESAADEKKEEPTGPSKMPDLKELGCMATTLFSAVKKGVTEIVSDYKAKRDKEQD